MKLRINLVVAILFGGLISPAHAIVNGTSAVGSNFVVATWIGEGAPQAGCTAAYLRPRVVVTGAHCVIKDGERAPQLKGSLGEFYVAQAGIDLRTAEAREKRVRVLKIWTEPDYFNRYNPSKNQLETQINDLAFLFLEKELEGIPISRAATKEEVEQFRLGNQKAFHLGYGMIGGANGEITQNDGKPYLVEGIVGTTDHPSHIPNRDRHLNVLYPNGQSIGPGDSGSPLMMKKGDEVLYLGTIYAGGGWVEVSKGNLSTRGVASVTVLWPFIPSLDEEWSKFLVEEIELLKIARDQKEKAAKASSDREERRKAALAIGEYYQELSSCHSNSIFADLQSNKTGTWTAVAKVEGWIHLRDTCHQPWTVYRAEKGELLRWRLADPSLTWEVFSEPLEETTSSFKVEIAANQSNTKIDVSGAPRILRIKKTITCVKGKASKKVIAVNPKCPSGYKKK